MLCSKWYVHLVKVLMMSKEQLKHPLIINPPMKWNKIQLIYDQIMTAASANIVSIGLLALDSLLWWLKMIWWNLLLHYISLKNKYYLEFLQLRQLKNGLLRKKNTKNILLKWI